MADIKQKYQSKVSLSLLFLDLKICKNLGFSPSEHCELGTRLVMFSHQEIPSMLGKLQ
jgi:hypothetical protein